MSIRVEPKDKKSILQVDVYENDGKNFRRETTFESGFVVLDVDSKEIDAKNKDGLKISKYSIEDHDYQNGSACFWYFDESMDEDEQEKIKDAWDQEWEEGLNNLGWFLMDQDIYFHGPLKIAKE
jgi:hypothetical protein